VFDPRRRLPIENKPSTKELGQVQEDFSNTFKEPEKPITQDTSTIRTEDTLVDPLRQVAIVEPKTVPATKPLSERLFGEPKTVSTASLTQGDTIKLFPGDRVSGVITTGEHVLDLRDDQKYYWSTSTTRRFTRAHCRWHYSHNKKWHNCSLYRHKSNVPGGRTPYEIVISTGKDVPVTIARANQNQVFLV
jgi:hypothetical protein